jgi:hypothetical protein
MGEARMKRYTCPHCKSQYHIEPNACPICLWSTGEDGPMLDAIKEDTITIRDGVAVWREADMMVKATPGLLMMAPQMLAALIALLVETNQHAAGECQGLRIACGAARAIIAAAREVS